MQRFVYGIHHPADGGGDEGERDIHHLCDPADGLKAVIKGASARRNRVGANDEEVRYSAKLVHLLIPDGDISSVGIQDEGGTAEIHL